MQAMEPSGVHIAHLESQAALSSLGSGPQGLSDAEAARRRREFGPNRIEAVAGEPIWLALLKEFTHFFALLLWFAAALAFYAEHFERGQGMAQLGFAIVAVIFINGLFAFWQTYRAQRALAALRELLPARVEALRGGRPVEIEAADLVPGDMLLLAEGAQVPADCRIVESWSLRVNLATLTGESLPRARSAESDSGADTLHARNLLLAGTAIVSGECRAAVYATGMNTEFGRIAHLTQTAGEAESPLQKEIRRVSRIVAALAIALGLVFFAIGHVIGLPFWANFTFAIGIIVANVPEGLLPTVTLALALATQRMARRQALVRHLPAVETLGSTTVILTDKTGTLTQNRMAVRELFVGGRHVLAARRWPKAADLELRAVARHCHSLKFPGGHPSGDPMEIALWEFGGTDGAEERVGEQPFDTERRRMSVTTHDASGRRNLWCKGAPEAVLPLCTAWIERGAARPLDAEMRQRLRRAEDDMADRGLRVLALAWRPLAEGEEAAEADLRFCGFVGLDDPPRPDVHEAVTRCRQAGVRAIMITGDHPRTALAIAREVGLVRGAGPSVILGDDVRRMAPAELQLALDAPEVLFARVTAEQKMLVVQALQHKGEVVAVTGDGVNDAPALKTADIGIAMGRSGTDVAREASDIVLLDDHFATIVDAVEEGRAVFDNIRKFLTYIFTHNFAELVPFLAFALTRIPLPLTAIQVLAIDLGTDTVPALALGAEPPHADVMQKPPRRHGEHLLSWRVLARAYLFLGPIEAVAAMAAFFFVLHGAGWHYGDDLPRTDPHYVQATTACLAAIVLGQIANLFVCRHPRLPAWRFPLGENRLLALGLATEVGVLLAIVYTPWGQELFATASLPAEVWLYMLPFALALAVFEEGRKALVRMAGRRPGSGG